MMTSAEAEIFFPVPVACDVSVSQALGGVNEDSVMVDPPVVLTAGTSAVPTGSCRVSPC